MDALKKWMIIQFTPYQNGCCPKNICSNHRRRHTVVVYFWGKMAAPWECEADELIKAGRISFSVTYEYVLMWTVVLHEILFGSSVAASWTSAASRTPVRIWHGIFNFFFYVLFTSRLKAPGSNPLINSRRVGISQYDSLPSLLYLWLFYV